MQEQTIQGAENFEGFKIEFNPWAVTDASVFLKYCCPECEFNDPILQSFADHAVSYHPNSSSLFIDEDNIELPNTQTYIKVEEGCRDCGLTDCNCSIMIENTKICIKEEEFSSLISNTEIESKSKCSRKKKRKTTSTNNPVLCEVCSILQLSSIREVKLHRQEKHMDGKETCCPYCDQRLKDFTGLKVHIDSVHPESGEKKFSCDECIIDFIFESSCKIHKSAKHKTLKKHACDVCEFETNWKERFDDHMITKHNSNKATKLFCELCEFSALTKRQLYRHKLVHHSTKSHKQCPYCEYKTTVKKDLHTHIDRKHQEQGGEKNYSCEDCGKSFIYLNSLTTHKRPGRCKSSKTRIVKVKEKKGNPICNVCGFESSRKDRFEHHMVTKHNADGATELFCEICGFSALTKLKLNRHKLENHNSIELKQCPYCYRKYRHNAGLHIHIDVKHEKQGGEKKYLCESCDKSFIFPESLTDHVKSHGINSRK